MNGPALLAAAMILDAVLGEPRWLWTRLPHPAVLMGRVVDALDRRLNRGPRRRAKGVAALCALVLGAGIAGWAVSLLGPAAEVICAAILLAQKSLAEHVSAVALALRRSVSEGRSAVSMIVSRDTTGMTAPQVARAAIESAAENFGDGVIAPAFWFLVAGLPGMAIYKAVNTADSMIGYRNDRYGAFGWASARLDDALNLVPARLAGLMIAGATGRLGTWADIAADARRHRSPNAGWPEAAMARALDVALAGPRSYDGETREFDWVNRHGRRDIGADEIDAAVSVLWRVWATALALAVAAAALLALAP